MATVLPRMRPDGISIGGWDLSSHKDHMLESRCHTAEQCGNAASAGSCLYCRYMARFDMPLPEETYAMNFLRITHPSTGAVLEFEPFTALEGVDAEHTLVEVACAKEWTTARLDKLQSATQVKPYDWTYSTEYSGTLSAKGWKVEETDERIDFEALKIREKILWHDDIMFFTDDFGDNGAVALSIRVRCMPSGFFMLLRQFIRVDEVLIRVSDTRVYHSFETDYLLRESVVMENTASEVEARLGIPPGDKRQTRILYRPEKINTILPHLLVKKESTQRLYPVASV